MAKPCLAPPSAGLSHVQEVSSITPPWRSTPLPPEWPTLRLEVLDRDGWVCQIRGPKCIGQANEVDHVGNANDHRPEMLRAACKPCHATRTGRQGRARQGKRKRETEPHPGMIT